MTSYAYSPDTGELIRTDTPSDWMGTTEMPPPDHDPAAVGCFWRGVGWELVGPQPPTEPVPASITMRQARLVLLGAGLLDAVNMGIKGMPAAAQVEWEFASEVRRDNALIGTLATALSLDDAALDAMFAAGAKL